MTFSKCRIRGCLVPPQSFTNRPYIKRFLVTSCWRTFHRPGVVRYVWVSWFSVFFRCAAWSVMNVDLRLQCLGILGHNFQKTWKSQSQAVWNGWMFGNRNHFLCRDWESPNLQHIQTTISSGSRIVDYPREPPSLMPPRKGSSLTPIFSGAKLIVWGSVCCG